MIEVNQYLIILLGFAVFMVGMAVGVSLNVERIRNQIDNYRDLNMKLINRLGSKNDQIEELEATIEDLSKYIDWEEAEKNGYSIPRK